MPKLSGIALSMLVLLLALIVGCGSYPQARYYKATPNFDRDEKNLKAFSLQASSVTISKPSPAKKPGEGEMEGTVNFLV
jgi:hypothetical protein